MGRERNEHAVKSGMEGIQKGYIYTSVLLFPIYNNIKRKYIYKKKKKWDSGTGTGTTPTDTDNGTTYAKRGSGQSIPVPHLLVPVPSG